MVSSTGGAVVPAGKRLFPEGTPVVRFPRQHLERHWLLVSRAATSCGTTVAKVKRWVKSGKVRVHPEDPRLVNGGDVEDAVEQEELFELSMTAGENDA